MSALETRPLEALVVRLSVLGAEGLHRASATPAVDAASAACVTGGEVDRAALAPHAARALATLAELGPRDAAAARIHGVARPVLERLAAGAASGDAELALRARLEERLAAIVVAMEDARAAGDDELAERLHARYIELGTSYAARIARDDGA